MITMYGMSERVGLAMLEKPQSMFLAPRSQNDFFKNYSPETAKQIGLEVNRILTDCYKKVKDLLTHHKESVKKIAEQLLKTEVLDETFKIIFEKEMLQAQK